MTADDLADRWAAIDLPRRFRIGGTTLTASVCVSSRAEVEEGQGPPDALPSSDFRHDNRLHVVAAVETDQAKLRAQAVLGEPGPSDLDAVGHRLGIPRPGHPIRIEPDHEHTESEGRYVHP